MPDVQDTIRKELVLNAVATAEAIVADEDEVMHEIGHLAEDSERSAEKIAQTLRNNGTYALLEEEISRHKALDFLVENAAPGWHGRKRRKRGKLMIRHFIEQIATVVGRIVGALAQALDEESKSQIRSDYNRVLRVCVCVISHLLILALFGLAVVVAYMLALGIPDGWPRWAFLGVELYGIWKALWLLK